MIVPTGPTLIRAMIGKDLQAATTRATRAFPQDDVVLEAVDFQAEGMQQPLSFTIAAGEIVGVTGIIGSGKSELGQGLFGVTRQTGGTLRLNKQTVRFRSPEAARKHGVAFIPEDRKQQGLLLPHSVEANLTLANLDRVSEKAFIVPRRRRRCATDIAERLRILPPNVRMRARNLSGGNQQKVVIGKWLIGDPTLLIMDEPTRGVDVGAKTEIYSLIESLAQSGKAVLVLSSEFDEVRRLCDRILVLRQGAIVGEMRSDEASGDRLLSLALGG